MELQGKKINFLGDSITEGFGVSCESARFTNLVANQTGALCRNYGLCASHISRQVAPADSPREEMDFCSRVPEMDPDADIVVVFGGTNDFGFSPWPLGQFTDRTRETFWGGLHTLYLSLIEKYPAAKIVILTPLHRTGEDSPFGSTKKIPTAPLKEYVRIIREAAEYYSLPVLDLYACSGMQPNVPVIFDRYVPDGLHPNDAGHVILAEKIVSFLRQL